MICPSACPGKRCSLTAELLAGRAVAPLLRQRAKGHRGASGNFPDVTLVLTSFPVRDNEHHVGEMTANIGSGKSRRAQVIRTSGSVNSICVKHINSVIVSTRILASIIFGRANRGLLAEAPATEETAASHATGTQRRSASALAAIRRRTVPIGPGARTGLVRRDGGSGADRLR